MQRVGINVGVKLPRFKSWHHYYMCFIITVSAPWFPCEYIDLGTGGLNENSLQAIRTALGI